MIDVFYQPEQCAANQSFSPSAEKPRLVVQDWLRHFEGQVNVLGFEPVDREAFKRVHETAMVDAILDCHARNGFGNSSPTVARSLPYTTGSLLAAAEQAVLYRTQTCSPTSGFHHATYDTAQSFCTFNGLMVTAVMLKEAGLVRSVGIIDCDAHYGNGTDEIIQRLGLRWVRHHTMGAVFHSRHDVQSMGAGQSTFTRWLQRAIDDVQGCSLILYQAGADPHVDDPLGGILTTQEMTLRDQMVFEGLRGKPLVWNLAGGYQTVDTVVGDGDDAQAARLEPVLSLHRNTLATHLAVLAVDPTR